MATGTRMDRCMDANGALGPIPAERERRLQALRSGADRIQEELESTFSGLSPSEASELRKVRDYTRGLAYSHPHLKPETYLTHPWRVANIVLRVTAPADIEAGTIALLHNVFESTPVKVAALSAEFGEHIAQSVSILTADRDRQFEPAYTRAYYDSLKAFSAAVQVVKVIDKLDNLFVLHLNPDMTVKTRYLDEIEAEVLPMVDRVLPRVTPYYRALVADVRDILHAQA